MKYNLAWSVLAACCASSLCTAVPATVTAPTTAPVIAPSTVPARATASSAMTYATDQQQSRLEFFGEQAGAEFKGEFHKFTALVAIAPDALASARIDVQIDVNSLDSLDQDRDKTMRSVDIFDVSHWPTAHYVTRMITKSATGFAALGNLTLHGVTKEVPIEFRFTSSPGGAKLEGTATLKRLDFGVGQGDWKSTEWVADKVKIHFALALEPKR